MTTLIIVRHAQSLANKAELFIGHKDMDLSELGFKQAELLCAELIDKKYPIDTIYSSDLLRPYHTVEPYAKATGKEIIKDRGLREIYAGKWEGHKFAELPSLFPETFGMWRSDISKCCPDGGETVVELYERINTTIDRIAEENDGKCLLIGTHATPLRCLIARANGEGVSAMKDLRWCLNAAINIFEYSEGVLSVKEVNLADHLGPLNTPLPKTI